jgi:hypothetical protein
VEDGGSTFARVTMVHLSGAASVSQRSTQRRVGGNPMIQKPDAVDYEEFAASELAAAAKRQTADEKRPFLNRAATFATLGERAREAHDRAMTDDEEYERHALDYQDRLAAMTDDDLRRAYLASDAEADDPWQTAMAVELQARGVDF